MPTIRLLLAALLLGAFLAPLTAFAQTPSGDALTSVAIDPSLFRDGAIRRFSGTHEAWSYVCDEVAKMKKRFCSLRTMVRDSAGQTVAALTVSTGEDGKPAALLRMAAASFNEAGIEVVPVASGSGGAVPGASGGGATGKNGNGGAAKGKPKPPALTKLYPAACKGTVCEMVWTLPVEHIEALSSGGGLQLRYVTPVAGMPSLAGALKGGVVAQSVVVVVASKGFAAAVDASVKPLQ